MARDVTFTSLKFKYVTVTVYFSKTNLKMVEKLKSLKVFNESNYHIAYV